MIPVTRINGRKLVLNADLIKFIEETPDTLITLTSGDKIYVQEGIEEIVRKAIEYSRSLRCFPEMNR
ncbi:MAG: flagellar protein [Planctomycetota bacterium]|nr:MAG: flagellar protein [Planctomycetota bacterium]